MELAVRSPVNCPAQRCSTKFPYDGKESLVSPVVNAMLVPTRHVGTITATACSLTRENYRRPIRAGNNDRRRP